MGLTSHEICFIRPILTHYHITSNQYIENFASEFFIKEPTY